MDNQHDKITGYRDLTQDEIDAINHVKEVSKLVDGTIKKLHRLPDSDKRWVNIGTTDLQKGFMALVRSIARPTSF